MNDMNETPEELLDSIVFGTATEEEVIATMDQHERKRFLLELSLHRSASMLIQQQNIIEQVKGVEERYLKNHVAPNHLIGNKSAKRMVRIFGAVAAVFVIAFTAIVLYWYTGNTSGQLYGERYEQYQVNVERSGDETNSPMVRDYQQNKFEQVIALNEQTPAVSGKEKMVVAGSFMELQRYDQAIATFKNILSQNIASGSRLYHDEAEYYLALAYIKVEQYDNAFALFNKIYTDKEHTFNAEIDWWFLTRVKWLK